LQKKTNFEAETPEKLIWLEQDLIELASVLMDRFLKTKMIDLQYFQFARKLS